VNVFARIAVVGLLALVACQPSPAEHPPGGPPAAAPTVAPAASTPPAAVKNPEPVMPAHVRAAVDAPDRSAADRALDAGRKPAELLAFFDIKPGMHVAELGAGGGYTAELLARVVGPKGKVYGQNSKFILERFAEAPWSERLKKPVMANVVRVDREFDSPLPTDTRPLDVVLLILFYHDTVWMKTDRAAMNKAIFERLKSGGVFGVVDHSARAGAGLADVETLHRIEEKIVVDEITSAGFRLEDRGKFLENPSDTRDWNASPSKAGERRGESDRFVLEFVKP
jgi:predicted methyltransferase